MANREWSMAELQSKAEAYCAAAEHCVYDVQTKLRQWDATPEQSEQIVNRLCDAKYIDEARYCHAFAHDKLQYQGWGRMKIRAALQARHLPADCIRIALEDIDETEYFCILERVIKQKKNARPEQVIRFCLQRGFTLGEIRRFVTL